MAREWGVLVEDLDLTPAEMLRYQLYLAGEDKAEADRQKSVDKLEVLLARVSYEVHVLQVLVTKGLLDGKAKLTMTPEQFLVSTPPGKKRRRRPKRRRDGWRQAALQEVASKQAWAGLLGLDPTKMAMPTL